MASPYSSDPEWADVQPLPQDDGPAPVVPIAYTAEFREVHDYFRAILKKNELSKRALSLTESVIRLNPANYTAWHFRRQCLYELKEDLTKELKWTDAIAMDSPKNYQLWYHRRELVERIDAPCDELAITAAVLKLDAKNYHAWSHRQWLLKRFPSFWQQELDYVDALIQEDLRNNSAWNQRHLVITNLGGWTAERVASELKYTMGWIDKAPNNESAWNYALGLVSQPAFTGALAAELEEFARGIVAKV